MEKNIYRLGIIGTGRIAHRFVPEARLVEDIDVVAVYNPKITSAKRFAEELNIETATDEMDAFIEQVDVVYIASPHETHVEYCRQMLLAGKHLLCEKPMSFSKKDAEELFALAEEKNLVLMEALKTAYCPGFKALIELVKSGKIGEVVDVEACFSRISEYNVREIWDENYGGSFTEFGTYPLLPIVKLLGIKDKNSSIWVRQAKNGTDVYTKTNIDYGFATALAKTGLGVKSEGQLVIAGTKGYVLAPSPWWLTKYFEVRYEDPNKIERYEFDYERSGLCYELQEFVERINQIGKPNVECISLTAEESIWFAEKMEAYLADRRQRISRKAAKFEKTQPVNIWAHRGCSYVYPENTLSAFLAAAEIDGIKGIELDVQLTKDDVLVVIHDETVDRTTNGAGMVCDFTLEEIKALEIEGMDGNIESVPTLEEVFLLLKKYCEERNLLINIELKNSKIRYEGMEQKLLDLVEKYEMQKYIVYSSFLPESMGLLKALDPSVHTGILGREELWCRQKMKEMYADAIHPWEGGLELVINDETTQNCPVRIWGGAEPFFGQNKIVIKKDIVQYAKLGVTDVITNVPEMYLNEHRAEVEK